MYYGGYWMGYRTDNGSAYYEELTNLPHVNYVNSLYGGLKGFYLADIHSKLPAKSADAVYNALLGVSLKDENLLKDTSVILKNSVVNNVDEDDEEYGINITREDLDRYNSSEYIWVGVNNLSEISLRPELYIPNRAIEYAYSGLLVINANTYKDYIEDITLAYTRDKVDVRGFKGNKIEPVVNGNDSLQEESKEDTKVEHVRDLKI